MAKKVVVLYLFESPVPDIYNSKTLGFGELRVIAGQEDVEKVIAFGRKGKSFYHLEANLDRQVGIEKKVEIQAYTWSENLMAYYLSWLPLLWYGWRICLQQKIDIIHAESPHISGIAAVILGKLLKIKIIVEYKVSYDALAIYRYGILWGKISNWLFWFVAGKILRSADYVAANSKTYQKYLKKKLGIHNVGFYNPAVIVPKGFQKKRHKGIVIGFIGRLYPDKGVIHFLRLVHMKKKWFRLHGVSFLIAGDGPEKSNVIEYILKNGLSDLVTVLGTVDKWDFFRGIDIYLNTTMIRAAMEMTIVEASMVGIPVIAFGNKKFPETVKNGFNGYVVETASNSILFDKLKSLISSPNLYRKMANNAIFYSERYALPVQESKLRYIYSKL